MWNLKKTIRFNLAGVLILGLMGLILAPFIAMAQTPQNPGSLQFAASFPDTYTSPDLYEVQVENGNYILRWKQMPTTKGAPAGGYDIIVDGVDTNSTHNTTQLNRTISGLQPGIEHCFQVEARWTQASPGVFSRSNQVCAVLEQPLPAEYTAPVLTSVQISGSDFVLEWSQPATSYGTPASGYDVFVDGVDTGSTYRTDQLTSTIGGLQPGEHCFFVEARWTQASPAEYPQSNQLCAVLEPTLPAEYTAPVLTSVQVSGSDFVLEWSQPASTYGTPAGGYDLFVDGVDTGSTYRTDQLTSTIGGLQAGEHCFLVEARWTQANPVEYPQSNQICAVLEGSDPSPLPPSSGGGGYSLRGNPGFSSAQLPSHVRVWYDRLWAAIENPSQYPNATSQAQSNDTYQYGRALNAYITALLEVLRVTGDLRLLDEVDRVAQLMRAELQDRSILTKNGSTYQSDGYLNWQYFYDAGYHGTDVHEMDEILSHSLVAAFAYAFHVNRDLDSRYAERADFWTDYLKNHFEAKWRKRKNKSTGPFMDKTLTHAYSHWIRYHYYMHLLTGEQWYQTEAIRKAEVVKGQMIEVNNGKAYVWNHFTHLESGSTRRECQYFYYGRKTVSAAVDLALEGFSVFTDAFVEKMAGTVTELIIDNGATDFAPDICGNQNMAGLVASGRNRETQSRWSISNYGLAGAWDSTGVINNIAEQVHMDIESNPDNPRRIFIPAGIVFSLLK